MGHRTIRASAPADSGRWQSAALPFFVLLGLLCAAYGAWLLTFWPGVLGEDSVAILQEVNDPGAFKAGKTVFWYFFIKLLYLPHRLVELPIAVQLAASAVVFARILSWYWQHGLKRTMYFALVFICLAPHMVYFLGSLYPDGIFSVAVTGLLFELWLAVRNRKISGAGLGMICLTLPFAAFARSNGLIYLAPAVLALFLVDRASRRWLGMITATWCLLIFGATRLHHSSAQEVVFPLVLFETVSFLKPRAMNDLWTQVPEMNDPWVLRSPKVSPHTVELLTRDRPLDQILAFDDPVYWDMLIFHPTGPQLGRMPEQDRKEMVREFFLRNLWRNLPDFTASRVNVFMASALAQGGFPAFTYARNVLERTHSNSVFRWFHLDSLEAALLAVHRVSHGFRWLLWTPWLGLGLLAWAFKRGWQTRDPALLLASVPMLLQLGAIFMISIAGEYRYLLPFFVLPLVLLPALTQQPIMRNKR